MLCDLIEDYKHFRGAYSSCTVKVKEIPSSKDFDNLPISHVASY
jgi:hypothetical protein